jgi:eukaryotic-like serine/threonine-protein kinase
MGPAEPGSVVAGRYRLQAVVGRGGMGAVWLAGDQSLHRDVAVKEILWPPQLDAGERETLHLCAVQGARKAAGLNHPNIVRIYDLVEDDGRPWVVMQFVPYRSLSDVVRDDGPLSPGRAAQVGLRIMDAIRVAHAVGVLHRDLKPGNVLLSAHSPRRQKEGSSSSGKDLAPRAAMLAKITDFGLAKRLDSQNELTHTGQILGTPNYMPPEQAAGNVKQLTETVDVYSLGAILYAMLTGRPPFQAESPLDVLVQVLESEPPAPSASQQGIPRELEWICLRCLDKQPSQRYASAEDLADDLRRFLQGEPVLARPAGLKQRLLRWARKEPSLAAHLGAIGLAMTVAEIRFAVQRVDSAYHLRVTGVLALWGLVSILCQLLLRRERLQNAGRYVWAGCDATLLTLLLLSVAAPLGPLLIGFPLLIAAAGLYFRVRLVVFTAASAIVGFAALTLLRHDETYPLHYAIFFTLILGIIGLIVAHQVQRVRVLSQYYDHRELP